MRYAPVIGGGCALSRPAGRACGGLSGLGNGPRFLGLRACGRSSPSRRAFAALPALSARAGPRSSAGAGWALRGCDRAGRCAPGLESNGHKLADRVQDPAAGGSRQVKKWSCGAPGCELTPPIRCGRMKGDERTIPRDVGRPTLHIAVSRMSAPGKKTIKLPGLVGESATGLIPNFRKSPFLQKDSE